MEIAEVIVEIDQEKIKKEIDQKVNEIINQKLFIWDINKMSELTCMSKSFLEKNILCDPRMKVLERKKDKGKRYWFYEESLKALKEILDEW